MAGIRIRLRRESAALAPSQAGETPGEFTLGAFIWPAVIAIVLLALVARAYNVDWDEGSHLHPDERHLSIVAAGVKLPSSLLEYFDSNSSPLNPYNRDGGSFVYGTLPLFLTKVVANALGKDDYDHLYLAGRWLSALFSAGAVLLVFLIGRRLYGSAAGLIGAVLMASAPLAIQQAHFFVVDPFLTLFTTALLFYSVRIVQDGRRSDYALAGLMLGLAMACKVTAIVIAPVLLVAVAARLWPSIRERLSGHQLTTKQMEDAGQALISLALAVFVAFVAFRVAQPYAFDTPNLTNLGLALNSHWLSDQSQQRELLGGDAAFPPSVQWIARSSYVYPLSEMVRWGMGPAFAIAGWAAFGFAAFRLIRRGDARHLLPVLFVLLYFGFMGRQFSLYLRYFLPLYPVLALLAGYALVELVRGAATLAQRCGRPQLGRAGYGAVAVVLALSLLAGLAYVSIYTRTSTRIEASRWIYENLPAGSTLASE
ncbi:MAG TPA: glycosyltransferase family 39 protein, partial [Dehalococcoidia bacterium]|nr:glycosyltransferase family 39 protein [Dehalococcoidia bacterium]